MFHTLLRFGLVVSLLVFIFSNSEMAQAAPYTKTYNGISYTLTGVEWYVSPAGTSSTVAGTGTIGTPWDLQTAFLGASGRIQPGDIVWIRGGTYNVPASGPFSINVSGTIASPVVFRNYNHERAVIDGRQANHTDCYLNASYVWLWGLEITDTDPSTPTFAISYGTYGLMSGSTASVGAKLINLIVHDNYNGGLGLYAEMSDVEVYGLLSFNNGRADSPNHGYGIYSQNRIGQKLIEESVFFNNFGNYPVHIYTETGYIDNFRFRKNAMFGGGNDGLWILLGGSRIAQNPVFEGNLVYGVGLDLGFQTFGAGTNNAAISSNLFWGTGGVGDRDIFFNPKNTSTSFSGNRIYNKPFSFSRASYPSNTYHDSRPTGTEVVYSSNRYDPDLGKVAVYNWNRLDSISLDLAQIGFSLNDRYQVYDVQNILGSPIAEGVYSGAGIPVSLALTSVSQAIAKPPGFGNWVHTDKELNIFLVRKLAATIPTVPNPPQALRIAP